MPFRISQIKRQINSGANSVYIMGTSMNLCFSIVVNGTAGATDQILAQAATIGWFNCKVSYSLSNLYWKGA